MTWGRPARMAWVGVWLACSEGVDAQPITVAGLQRLLQQAPPQRLYFRETHESPWLAAPVESSGSMMSNATMLEKRVEQPRRETWRILPDRMQLLAADSSTVRELMFNDAPAVAALASALLQVMAADLQALDKDFRLAPSGDERQWTLQLTPRHADVARFLKQLELQGAGTQLRLIVILQSQGERTTTRLTAEPWEPHVRP